MLFGALSTSKAATLRGLEHLAHIHAVLYISSMKVFKILFGLIRMALNPGDYKRVENFRETLRRYQYFASAVKKVKECDETRTLMLNQPVLDWSSLDYKNFSNLPEESLGYQFAAFLKAFHLNPLEYSRDVQLSDEEYFIRRVVQTHDIWHVVLGYGTDELGEIGINSFMLAQIGWPPAGFYIGGYTLRQMLKAPHKISDVIAVVAEGWRRGLSSRALFAMEWEKQFQRPILEIRKELALEASASATRHTRRQIESLGF